MNEHPDEPRPAAEVHPPGAEGEFEETGQAGEETRRRRIYPRWVYNPISLTGAALAIAMLFAILLMFVVDATSQDPSPYIGILGFAVLPIPLIIGLLLIPVGMWLEWRRERKSEADELPLPTLDMNRPDHRTALLTFGTGSIIFLILTAGGSFKAYEYTESVRFCGTVCHEVMEPEYTTYLNGPHARVDCVECHIGEGAKWYVRSKISGAYQIYSVLFNRYPQPIPTPIENLRPARETCEHCHWPAKFHGDQMWEVARYLNDEENTRWRIQLIMKTGGADEATGQIHGIHWHIAQRVEYIPADSTRQEIREVRYHRPDGEVVTYRSLYNPLQEEELQAISADEIRTMDCMDCHNRPSHQYLSPRRSMDQAFETDLIPDDLPFLKREGTNLLAAEYADTVEALRAIETGLRSFYSDNYPELPREREADIARAVAGVQQVYSLNFFPYMKVRWSAYPTHIGHQESPGCFRCHNGMMATDDGTVIRNDCELCHTILTQGPGTPGITETGMGSGEFRHPVNIDQAWMFMACHECHTGGEYY